MAHAPAIVKQKLLETVAVVFHSASHYRGSASGKACSMYETFGVLTDTVHDEALKHTVHIPHGKGCIMYINQNCMIDSDQRAHD